MLTWKTQVPFWSLHGNCHSLHWLAVQLASSEASAQSFSPSHSQLDGTHWLLAQVNSSAEQLEATLVQFTSSEPSWQSFSRSQRHLALMHWPLSHLNNAALKIEMYKASGIFGKIMFPSKKDDTKCSKIVKGKKQMC